MNDMEINLVRILIINNDYNELNGDDFYANTK